MKNSHSSFFKSALFLIPFLCAFLSDSQAQFSDLGLKLIDVQNSSVNWVDFDGDGDLDACVSGRQYFVAGSRYGTLYFLESGALDDSLFITTMSEGKVEWCDFNNDSTLDHLYSGYNGSMIAGIDTFNIVDNTYATYISDFTALKTGSLDWGDYDNDGDYDVVISGQDGDNNIATNLYRNDKGSFADVAAGLPGIIEGNVGFVDYDLDQDLDIFITGKDINTNKYTRLWKNTNGHYSITDDQFINLRGSQFDWGDFNSDGYPDLLLGGNDGNKKRGLLYINNSGLGFTLSDTIVPGSMYGSSIFGDFDNDGDMDIFSGGEKENIAYSEDVIYINDGSDSLKPTGYLIDPEKITSAQLGDFDNDLDLDFIVNGYNSGPGSTSIHENLSASVNVRPTAPENLVSAVSVTDVLLSWDPATDNNTPVKALTYNIYLGTQSEGIDIVSPNATIANGYRKISRKGYIQDTAWVIKNLPVGTYYWGVQALDNSFTPSLFSVEDTFEIKEQFTTDTLKYPVKVTSPSIYFDYDHDEDYDLFMSGETKFVVSVNTDSGFSDASFDTIFNEAFSPILTISPNDYNNNNTLDFSISGNYTGDQTLDSSITLFGYAGSADYTIVDSALVSNAIFEYVLWTDLNNDGLQDLVSSGMTSNLGASNEPLTYIYKNMGDSTFSEILHTIPGFYECGAVAADFDNDMDNDLIIYGKDALGNPNTFVYENTGEFTFSEHEIPNNELFRSFRSYTILTGDYNLDGELDIYMTGENSQGDFYARVLLNNSMNFSDANLPLRSWEFMSNYWADYDYDGDLDIFSTSTYHSADEIKLYINNDQILEETTIELLGRYQLDMPFISANLDNENGFDFLFKINDGYYVKYYDNYEDYNKLSAAPGNIGSGREDFDLILSWDKLPSCPGCTYNIRVGTHIDSVDIMSPMADLSTGFRYLIRPGNTSANNSWKLSNLPVDKYYWSVQAVDLAYTGGPWAEVDSFIVTNVNSEFSFDTVCLGDTTHFYDLSVANDPINAWKWQFDDGASSTLQNPLHLFESADTFNVTLWAYAASGDSASQSHAIIVKQKPSADFTASTACFGVETDFINTTSMNELTASTWLWEFGDGKSSILEDPGTNGYLSAGDFNTKLTVNATNGCLDTIIKVVQVAAIPEVAVTADAPLDFCMGDSVNFTVPYNSSYFYNWKLDGTLISAADSSKYTAKQSGSFTVEVENPLGSCVKGSDPINVSAYDIPVSPTINNDGPLTFCSGDSVKLSVNNNLDYDYLWKLNDGGVGDDTCVYFAKSSGTYTLVLSNSNDCSASAVNSIVVTVLDNPSLPVVNVIGDTDFCEGESVELNVTNDPDLSYQWMESTVSIGGETSSSYSATTSGEYNLLVTNTDACTNQTDVISVTVYPSPGSPTISVTGETTFCLGDSSLLSVTLNPALDYEWFLNSGYVGHNENTLYVLESGEYSLKVINSDFCETMATNTVTIAVNNLPSLQTVNVNGFTDFCENDSVELSVSNDPNLTYQWKDGELNVGGATSNIFIAKTSGEYNLEVTNSNSCSRGTDDISITVYPTPSSPTISVSGETTFCQGDSTLLSVAPNPDLSYEWFLNGGYVGDEENTQYVYSSGDYNLKVTNSDYCEALSSNTITITANPLPSIPAISVTGLTEFCNGEDVLLSVNNDPTLNYQWKVGNVNIAGANNFSYSAENSGDYNLTVSNSNLCSRESDIVAVTVYPVPSNPSISVIGDTIFCNGDSTLLSVTQDPSLEYEWLKNGGSVGYDQNTLYAYSSGEYTLKVYNSDYCEAISANSVNIQVNPLPSYPVVNAKSSNDFCDGDSVILSKTYDANLEYQWYKDKQKIGGATNSDYEARIEGDYTLEVVNLNGCSSLSDPESVVVYPTPSNPTISLTGFLTFCQGDSSILSVPDNPALEFQWYKDGEYWGDDNPELSVLYSGSYTLEVMNDDYCTALSNNTIDILVHSSPAEPSVYEDGDLTFCMGDSVTLSTGSDPSLTYQWKNGDSKISGATDSIYVAKESGNYKIIVSNASNCSNESEFIEITRNENPTPPTISSRGKLEFCAGDSLNLFVSDIYESYKWFLNGGTIGYDQSSHSVAATGTYSLEVENADGCKANANNQVYAEIYPIPTIPAINLRGSTSFCIGDSAFLNASDPGSDHYQWMNEFGPIENETGSELKIEESGAYKLQVWNDANCKAVSQEYSFDVIDYPRIPLITHSENYIENGCPDFEPVTLSITEIEQDVAYQWKQNGAKIQDATDTYYTKVFDDGFYYSILAERNGCEIESENLTISYAEMPPKPSIIAEGPTVWYLACSNDSALSYKWYRDDVEIANANKHIYVANNQLGKYEVAISTVNNGCFAISDAVRIPLGTGINSDPWAGLKIYPNPTPGLFTLEMDNFIMGELIIDILNERGSQILNIKFQKETSHFQTQIDLSGQPAAVYMISLMLEEYRASRRLIVE